jgi:predicted metal-dependent phosphoesterase TrpH
MEPINDEDLRNTLISYIEGYVLAIAETEVELNVSMHDTMLGSLFATARVYAEVFQVNLDDIIMISLKESDRIIDLLLKGSDSVVPNIEIN